MEISLAQFEKIDGLASTLFRMGDFMDCADPREYIRTQNRLLDACAAAMGWDFVDQFSCAEHCAARIITGALTCELDVVD